MESSSITGASLTDLCKRLNRDDATPSMIETLREFHLIDSENKLINSQFEKLGGKATSVLTPDHFAVSKKAASSSSEVAEIKDLEKVLAKITAGGKSGGATTSEARVEAEMFSESMGGVTEEVDVVTTMESFADFIKRESTVVNSDQVLGELSTFARKCSLSQGYLPGEIKVMSFGSLQSDAEMIIAAGTMVLDAILYLSLKGSEDHKELFSFEVISVIPRAKMLGNLINGKNALCAAVCMVYNRGSLPEEGSAKPLQNFIRKNLPWSDLKLETENDLAMVLSCAGLSKFPADSLLRIDLSLLPAPVAGRAQLSIAGNKIVRLAALSLPYASRTIQDVTKLSPGLMPDAIVENGKLARAIEIVECLVSQLSNVKGQLNLHPLTKNRKVPAGFVAGCIKAILFRLTMAGRTAMIETIGKGKMGAFAQDINLVGVIDLAGNRAWPLLSNDEIDFMRWSKGTISDLYGGK